MTRKPKTFALLLKEARGALTLRGAADRIGVSATAITQWENGVRPSQPELVRQIADGLGKQRLPFLVATDYLVTPEDLRHDEEKHGVVYLNNREVWEVLGRIGSMVDSTGQPVYPEAHCDQEPSYAQDEMLTLGDLAGGIYSVRARGDCMKPFAYDGDVLFVRPIKSLIQAGHIFILLLNGGSVCRELSEIRHTAEGTSYVLTAKNGDYAPVTVAANDVRFQGRVVGILDLHSG